uniref:Uncharacterized protein n=1 Tax=Siphoviridae sp. ct37J14 TaxID=2826280 RepID=A0A8S5M1A1_9CAUD|nr:MAG TPA: hypothetical protein [Siphoviridae sp. ct37J14]
MAHIHHPILLALYLLIHTNYNSFRSTISYHLLELNAIISYN